MNNKEKVIKAQEIIFNKVGYTFKDENLLEKALRHPSFVNQTVLEDYNRLEFLGNSILNFIVAEILFEKYPARKESDLTQMRKNIVDEDALTLVANELSLSDCILIAPKTQLGKKTPSDVIEAIIAAIYLDSERNISLCEAVVEKLLGKLLSDFASMNKIDYKSRLNENFPGLFRFEYQQINNQFESILYINDKKVSAGYGAKKKEADQDAAKKFYENYKEI